MIRHILYFLTEACLFLSIVSCSKEDIPAVSDVPRPQITVLISSNGLGDNGYNDLIISGMFAATNGREVDLRLVSSYTIDEAKEYVEEWVELTADRDSSLLILASDEFTDLIQSNLSSLSSRQRVLVIDAGEENWPDGVYGFKMQRYGCSYLAGCMAQYEDVEIWAAAPGRKALEDAISGFQDGMKAYSDRQCRLSYIADDETGFEMQDSVYNKMSYLCENDEKEEGIVVRTIYPLLGNSINGVIRYLNAKLISTYILVGMDVDMGMLCNSIPFSVVNHVDRVTVSYITDWLEGKEWKKKRSYGLASGMMEIVLSLGYYDSVISWGDDFKKSDIEDTAATKSNLFGVYPGPVYAKEGTFGRLLEQYKEEAFKKEEIYEKE